MSLKWMVAHEVAHIRFGHLALKQTVKSMRNRAEVNQSLEMDADTYSAARLVRLTRDITAPIEYGLDFVTPFGPGRISAMWAITFMASVLFWLDGGGGKPIEDFDESGHPHAAVRWYIWMGTLEAAIKRDFPTEPDLAAKSAHSVQGVLEIAANGLAQVWSDLVLPGTLPAYEDVAKRAERLLAIWADIRPELNNLAYVYQVTR